MLRGHLAAWLTVAFAALLVLLTVSDQGPGAFYASLLLLGGAVAVLALFYVTEQSIHARRPR